MLLIGIDWADDHHDAAFMDEAGNVLEQFRFSHDHDGFNEFHRRVSRHETPADEVLVAIETAHGLLVHHLFRLGFVVYAVNPKKVSRYKDRVRATNSKDDKLDARTMADILRTDRHRHHPLTLNPEQYRLLEELCKGLTVLINDTNRLTNRLLQCLKDHYPALIGSFGTDSDIFYALLKKYPTPQDLAKMTAEDFKKFLREHRYSVPSKGDQLFEHLKRPTPPPDPVAVAAGKFKLQSLTEQIIALRNSCKLYESEIKSILNILPEGDVVSSLPGAGPRTAPQLAALLGPSMQDAPKRFSEAKEIANLSGISPVTKQSGRHKVVLVRYPCKRPMRHTFRNWAAASIKCSRWAKAFYGYQYAQCHSHETILRKLAAKWIKIAYHIWSKGELYDENVHIAELKKRGVVWAMGL